MAMKGGEAKIVITIDADKAQQILGKVDDQVKVIDQSTSKGTKSQQSMNDALKSGKAQWALYSAGISGAISIATQLAAVVGQIGSFMKEGAKAAAIEKGFRKAVPAADELLAKMERATAFQMDETSLMRFGAKMKRAGMDMDQIADVMELAAKAANATGQDLHQTVEGIATSFIRINDRGFKAVDLNLNLQKLFTEQGLELGKSTTLLENNEKRTKMLTEATKALGDAYGDINLDDDLLVKQNQFIKKWDDFVSNTQEESATMAGELVAYAEGDRAERNFIALTNPLVELISLFGALNHEQDQSTEAENTRAHEFKKTSDVVIKKLEAEADIRRKLDEIWEESWELLDETEYKKRLAIEGTAAALDKKRIKTVEDLLAVKDQTEQTGRSQATFKTTMKLYKEFTSGDEYDLVKHFEMEGSAWEQARKFLKEARGENLKFMKDRVAFLTQQAKITGLYPEEISELKKLESSLAAAGIAMHSLNEGTEDQNVLASVAVMSAERMAQKTFDNKVALTNAAIAAGNYRIAIDHASSAVKVGERAGEGYRVKTNEQRNALIELTRAEIKHASAILEKVQAQAIAEGSETGMTAAYLISAEYKATVKKIEDLEKLQRTLQGKADTKLKAPPSLKPKAIGARDEKAIKDAEQREKDFQFFRVSRALEAEAKMFDATRDRLSQEKHMAAQFFSSHNMNAQRAISLEEERVFLISQKAAAERLWAKELAEAEARDPVDKAIEGLTRHQEVVDELGNAIKQKQREIQDVLKQMNQSMFDAQMESIRGAMSMASDIGSQFGASMLEATYAFEAAWERSRHTYQAMIKAGQGHSNAMKAAVPGMISGAGKVASAFAKSEGAKAKIMAGVEGAAALAAFAMAAAGGPAMSHMWQAGVMHTLAAAAYAAVASEAGKSAKKPPAAPARSPGVGRSDSGPSQAIHLHFAGSTIIGNDKTAGEQLAGIIGEHTQWTDGESKFEVA